MLEKVNTMDMIRELRKRGYCTELMFSVCDVDTQLDELNEDRDEADQIEMSKADKQLVLDMAVADNSDYICNLIDNSIKDKILNYHDQI